ncbi:hypothetical protein [Dyadobacter jiangsuensis]|uniref:Uncharacterized protein n=1 Tax=Dyadobacter jiangsuensis TaxID=1591085 RepID=A0A2P8G6H1_9BACT|nr:hypothetical protein [Dyadobacter jiangsuensis]PSL29572.1 hypothetical protein CLV60_105414 [Dyadobacter jiangsuensis]
MNALRLVEKPKNGKLSISLPETFTDDPVEVIIRPLVQPEIDAESRLKIAQQYLKRSKPTNFDLGDLDPHEQ